MSNILKIEALAKSFDKKQVLQNINLSIKKGEIISLIGSSGSGKSTLLRCINLLEQPDSGAIIYNGTNVLSEDVDIDLYRSELSMVFQHFNLFENLSTIDNLCLAPTKVLNKTRNEAEETAYYYLEKVGLEQFANHPVTKLSGGQKQRVAIARGLCMNPNILLFDEPTSALDPEVIEEVLNVIRDIANLGITMLIVTHEMSFAKDISDRVIYMKDGIIEYEATSDVMFTNPENIHAKNFLNRILK